RSAAPGASLAAWSFEADDSGLRPPSLFSGCRPVQPDGARGGKGHQARLRPSTPPIAASRTESLTPTFAEERYVHGVLCSYSEHYSVCTDIEEVLDWEVFEHDTEGALSVRALAQRYPEAIKIK
ncbi:MAG: hypothetical protein HY744_29810, partial [Deltaproteobacteria bacterium]|nr:hypothetical protein [Deltaproteobacteria bacterium]